MVCASKILPPQIGELGCQEILHPWTESCVHAYVNMYVYSCFGSAGYFALLYFFQYIVRAVKNKKQSVLKEIIGTYIRSNVLFSSLVASSFIGFSCLFRKILGRFYYYSIALIPATLAGWAISNENERNKDFFPTVFANLALESWFNKINDTGTIKLNKTRQTFAFMLLSSIVSYLFTKTQNENKYFWFFLPPKADSNGEKDDSCFHKGSCFKNILSCFAKYFTTGFLLRLLKLIFSNFKKPKIIVLSLLNRKTYSFAAFLGFYTLIYQSIRCFFYQKCNRFLPIHDSISGFLSGTTYIFEPNISVFNSAAITIFQILLEIGCREKILPVLPYRELMFAISCGRLFHSRLFTPRYCPPLMHYIMSSVTNKKCDYICNNYYKLMQQL